MCNDLPKVIRITNVTDAGDATATCPHCGATGRYIYHFDCADGTHRGAMKGCFSHFPKHKFVAINEKLLDKAREYKAKGWNLPSWDNEMLAAIDNFANGVITEKQAASIIDSATRRRNDSINAKYGRNRR